MPFYILTMPILQFINLLVFRIFQFINVVPPLACAGVGNKVDELHCQFGCTKTDNYVPKHLQSQPEQYEIS